MDEKKRRERKKQQIKQIRRRMQKKREMKKEEERERKAARGRPRLDLTCAVEGCERKHQARGLCAAHYRNWYNNGFDPEKFPTYPVSDSRGPRPRERGECAVEGCDLQEKSRGVCNAHYHAWRTYNFDPERLPTKLVGVSPKPRTCSVEGCDRVHQARGCCLSHYTYWRNNNFAPHLFPVGRIERRLHGHPGCSVEGCERNHYALTYCRMHYVRFQRRAAS